MARQFAVQATAPAARQGRKDLWFIVAWIVATAAVGWLLAFPLLAGEFLGRQLVGTALDAPWKPFGSDRDGKTALTALVFVFIGIPLLLLGFWIGRTVRRRFKLRGSLAAAQHAAALILLLTPYLLARSGWLF